MTGRESIVPSWRGKVVCRVIILLCSSILRRGGRRTTLHGRCRRGRASETGRGRYRAACHCLYAYVVYLVRCCSADQRLERLWCFQQHTTFLTLDLQLTAAHTPRSHSSQTMTSSNRLGAPFTLTPWKLADSRGRDVHRHGGNSMT